MISGRLAETEAAMADAKNKAGVVDLTAAMADYQTQEAANSPGNLRGQV